MSPADLAFWERAHNRAAGLQPDVAAALLRAYQLIRDSLSDAELAAIIASGNLADLERRVFTQALFDRAFLAYRVALRQATERAFRYAVRDLPNAGRVQGVLAIRFDYLSPRVIDAVRTMETTAMTTLREEIRNTVRAFVENGLRDGDSPLAIARTIRAVVGLAPNQLQAVENLRTELETGQYASAAERALLDQRFNLAKLDTLTAAEKAQRIDTIVQAYRKSFIAFHAETVSRTTTLDAYKVAQQLAWKDAEDKGLVPRGRLMKQWVHLDAQPDPRPTHMAMGKLPPVPADLPYTNGDMYAGQSDPWNCHCLDRYFVAAAA